MLSCHHGINNINGCIIKKEMIPFCYYCFVAEQGNLLAKNPKDSVLSKIGFSTWKNALSKFGKRQCSAVHKEAVNVIEAIPKMCEMLSTIHAEQKSENREMLYYIMSTIRYLGRQDLATHGKYKSNNLKEVSGELDFNFVQLLKSLLKRNLT